MSTKDLIDKKLISNGLKLQKLKLKALAPLIIKALKLQKVNTLYANNANNTELVFIDKILEELQVNYKFNADELENIPKHEPFIVVSNHPYGGIDGLILMRLISGVRPDYKMLANYLLQLIPELIDKIVTVNPFANKSKTGINVSAVKKSLSLLQQGHPIGIFPAGEVSAFQLNNLKVSDKQWNPVVGKMIMKAQVKVIPVYFSGHNSLIFNLLGLVHPVLRTAKLPSELFNKKNDKITVRIGKPVSIKTINEFADPNELLRYLRAKTYALSSSLIIEPTNFNSKLKYQKPSTPEPIITETPLELIEQDIQQLNENEQVCTHQNYAIYIASARKMPSVIREISRLREITFRAVGEGTNNSCDTDEYDLYYKHLFIWDTLNKKIVGAYRIGKGDVLFKRYNKNGFYLNELFKMQKGFTPILKSSLELGRSFISIEYQKKPLSLMLLWKGVLMYLAKQNGRYKYLIGPVSISNDFSSLSKDLLVDYIRKNHFDTSLAKFVSPRKKYTYQHKGEGADLKNMSFSDIKKLDQIIEDIEVSNIKSPVLLKKYLKQNAKIIAFNIDPKFNNALDGFLVLDVSKIPEDTFEMTMK